MELSVKRITAGRYKDKAKCGKLMVSSPVGLFNSTPGTISEEASSGHRVLSHPFLQMALNRREGASEDRARGWNGESS